MGDAAHVLTVLDEDDVPIKTLQGLKALRIPERSFTIHARTLALLKLADGKRTVREIRALDHGPGDTAEVLAYLHAIGLVQVAGMPALLPEQPKPQEAASKTARAGYVVRPRPMLPQSNACWWIGPSKPWGRMAACAWRCRWKKPKPAMKCWPSWSACAPYSRAA